MMTKKPKPKPIKKKAIRKPKESGIPRKLLTKQFIQNPKKIGFSKVFI